MVRASVAPPHYDECINDPPWNKRGWTYQEAVSLRANFLEFIALSVGGSQNFQILA